MLCKSLRQIVAVVIMQKILAKLISRVIE